MRIMEDKKEEEETRITPEMAGLHDVDTVNKDATNPIVTIQLFVHRCETSNRVYVLCFAS